MIKLNKTKVVHCNNLDKAEELVKITLGNMAMEGCIFDDKDRVKLLEKCLILLEEKEKGIENE